MSKFLLGVDGGNSKTDYLLTTIDGEFVDVLRTGTCSHECFDDGFDGMDAAMRRQLDTLFSRNNITAGDIAAAGMGLAGADHPFQVEELRRRITAMGVTRFTVANDGILGIKAAAVSGTGLCAVNGTGTVVIGIDERGEILQVGGVGRLSGDNAGGGYIRTASLRALYSFYYRKGPNSTMFPRLLAQLEVRAEELHTAICDWDLLAKNLDEIVKIAAECAKQGDTDAKKIMDGIAISVAKSTAGCMEKLYFTGTVDVVLVGSIWHKTVYTDMTRVYQEKLQSLAARPLRIIRQEAPAALGGVIWAKQIADRRPVPPAWRESIISTLTPAKYDEWVKK
jgi:N-acetylglucosamine kinase-like BadF-type ATPase